MNLIAGIIFGSFVALFVVLAVGTIAVLRKEAAAARTASGEISQKLGVAETQRDALSIHCNELRQMLAIQRTQLLLTDEQVYRIARAIFQMTAPANATKERVN